MNSTEPLLPSGYPARHRVGRSGWLRAAVLGANDGVLTMTGIVLALTAAHGTHASIMVAGVAGLVAGAMSMAAGEYVSVHSQADIERADLALERAEIDGHSAAEHRELAAIYVDRGLDEMLAAQVATQLMAHDALGAHARDELGIVTLYRARPAQAALASAASFALGGAAALSIAAVAPRGHAEVVSISSLVLLACLGGLAARAGGANIAQGAARITLWGAATMALTTGVGWLVGQVA